MQRKRNLNYALNNGWDWDRQRMSFLELGQEKKHSFRGRNEPRTRVSFREIMEKKGKKKMPH